MLRKVKQKIYNPTCLSCGSYFVLNHLFCLDCFKYKIQPRIDQSELSEQTKNCYHLIDWIPDESDLLSEMVYRFKSDKCYYAWNFYAHLALEVLKKNILTNEIDYIVTIPGSKKSSTHSEVFADFLHQEINKPVLNLLKKVKTKAENYEQKNLNRWDRQKTQFQIREQITHTLQDLNLASKHILVVDDIRTTGSSFRQAVDVLGPVKKASLLTLFHRKTKNQSTLVS